MALPCRDPAHAALLDMARSSTSRRARRYGRAPASQPYVASKGGLDALTRSIAVDYGREGIRCNALSVGYVENERRDAGITPERRAELEAMHRPCLGLPRGHRVGDRLSRQSRERLRHRGAAPVDGGGTIARGRVLG